MASSIQHWGVDVRINGKQILTIESNCLFGKPDLSEQEEDIIRFAAQHLLAFVGKSKAEKTIEAQQAIARSFYRGRSSEDAAKPTDFCETMREICEQDHEGENNVD